MLSNLVIGMCGLASYGDIASTRLAGNAHARVRVFVGPRQRRAFAPHSADLCRSAFERAYDPLI